MKEVVRRLGLRANEEVRLRVSTPPRDWSAVFGTLKIRGSVEELNRAADEGWDE